MMTKCDVESWMDSWNKNTTAQNKVSNILSIFIH